MVVAAFLLGFFVGHRFNGSNSPAAQAPAPGSPGPTQLMIPAGQPVVGFLDALDGKTEISVVEGGDLRVSGWAGCAESRAQVARVEILIDNQPKANAAMSRPRPDVASAYGRRDFEKSGWKADLSTKGLPVGSHPITARIACTNGQAGVLPPFQLIIKGP
jgi:hypothetical protein